VIEERQDNLIHATLLEISRQRAGCKCVCSGGTSSDSTTKKEAVFCKFDLTYLFYCLQGGAPSLSLDIRCDEGRSLEGTFIKKKHVLPFKYIRSNT
jgi:hypothetical protein